MKYIFLIASITLFSVSHTLFSQDKTKNFEKIISKNGQRFIKQDNINSVSIGIFKDGKAYTGHFGELEKGKGNPPTDNTLYEVGSVSKTITGYLVARAVLEKKLNLEDDITLFLEGDYSNLQFKDKVITIKHLLTHTSGLPPFLPLKLNEVFVELNSETPQKFSEFESSYNKETFLKDLQTIRLDKAPGSSYAYSNVGAQLMGHILEKVYQKSIDVLIQESFSKKFNMPNTAIHLNSEQMKKVAYGYWMENTKPSPLHANTAWGTDGGVKMDMNDIMQYCKLQLDATNPIVKESHKVLYKQSSASQVAYFWRVWNDKHGTSYNHHGGSVGTQNWLFIFPEYNLGISVVTNQSDTKTPELLSKTAKKILKSIL